MEDYKEKVITLLNSQELSKEQKEKLESIFPELKKESEDERIRKELLNHLKKASYGKTLVVNTLDYKRWADWLEKQGEKKSFARYKVGDTIYYDSFGRLVSFVIANIVEDGTDNPMYEDKDGNSVFQNDIVKQKPADRIKPKFNIGDTMRTLQEANDGYTDGMPVVVSIDNEYYHCTNELIAIKDQDDYEFPPINAKQKPAWSEEDEEIISQLAAICHVAAHASCAKFIDWLKSIKDRVQPKQEWKQENTHDLTDFENVMMHIGDSFFGPHAGLDPNDTIAIKEQATILLGLVPKQEWSEEDEEYCQCLIKDIEKSNPLPTSIYSDCKKWLKSLKDRIISQQKQEWSEGDESMRIRCIGILGKCYMGELPTKVEEELNWLKSIRPQSRWKPSDEEMKALNDVISSRDIKYDVLSELWEDLKKLREE